MEQLKKTENGGIDYLIRCFFTEEFDNKKAKIYFEAVHYSAQKVIANYSYLTEYVYSHYDEVKRAEDGNTEETYWPKNVEVLKNYLNKNISDYNSEDRKEILELPYKISEDIALAIIQYKQFFEELTEANDELKIVEKENEEANDELKIVKREYKKANDELKIVKREYKKVSVNLDNSSSNFISMLGIFSALIFAVFGGFEAFKSIFTNINTASISMIFINSSILMIGLIILIFLLIQSICILSGKTFLACGCKNTSNCTHNLYERYPLFSLSIGFFLLLFLAGLCL